MPQVPIESTMPETASCSGGSRRFGNLRGVQWRIDLGILPSSPSASVDDLRRVTANSRRSKPAQLLKDLERQLGFDEDKDTVACDDHMTSFLEATMLDVVAFMKLALQQAKVALDNLEVPVGPLDMQR